MAKRGRPPRSKPESGPDDEEIDDGTADVDDRPAEVIIKEWAEKREAMAQEITDILYQCSSKLRELLELEQNLYLSLSQPDALLSDCPLSPAFTKEWARQQLYANGLKFGEDIYDGEITARPFIERIKASTPWIMRFSKPKLKKKTGIEAIVEETI